MNEEFKKLNRIKKLRKEKGVTQKELAAIAGISQGMLTNYENGKRSPRDSKVWIKLAAYFGVDVSYLMGTSNKVDPSLAEDHVSDLAMEEYEKEKAENISKLIYELDSKSVLLGFGRESDTIMGSEELLSNIVNLSEEQFSILVDLIEVFAKSNNA